MNNKNAFSLVELLVVISVVGILSAVSIPVFKGVTASQNLKRSIDGFSSDVNIVREKALTGISNDAGVSSLWWGVRCTADSNKYELGYSMSDAGGNPTGSFVSVETKYLVSGVSFSSSSCATPLYFERLSGKSNSASRSIQIQSGSESLYIGITPNGNVRTSESVCGDGVVDSASEVCDTGGTSSPNISVDKCIPGYGGTCTYCESDCSKTGTVSGGYCGNGTKDGSEQCDYKGRASPNISIDKCIVSKVNPTCIYCTTSCKTGTKVWSSPCNEDGHCGKGEDETCIDCRSYAL